MPESLRWKVAEPRPTLRDRIANALGVEPIIAQVLVNRGHDTSEKARRFLDASLDTLADPDLIVDVDHAAGRLAHAVRAGEPITIYGDYDADGVTATSILLRGLSALGGQIGFYIPSRFAEGYGLNDAALARIAAAGGHLVVSVDCGVTAVNEIARARQRGQEIIVVDHHEPAAHLPPALAVIDPKRRDRPSPFGEYSAAGLAFQLLRAVRRRLGVADVPGELLDLAALGTIADLVPLIDDNRILARWGLARMTSTPTPGLAALIQVAGLTGQISTHHVGFALAPRINAAGRLGDAAVAVRLLTTEDPAEALAIANQLDEENRRRRALCDQILAEAIERVEGAQLQRAPAIVVAGEGWHAGVIGIVASQLTGRYSRPVVMIAVEGEIGKGSARSIAPFHIVDALKGCEDLLTRFGGHAMAAGLTLSASQIPEFARRFTEVAGERLTAEDLTPSIVIDAQVSLAEITETLARQVGQLAPFGLGNPDPVLAARGLRAVTTRVMGDGLHLRLGVTDERGYAEAVGFRLGDASELLAFTRARVDLAFTVGLDRWEDRERVQLMLRDLQTPGVELDEVLTDSRLLVERLFSRAVDYLGDGALGLEEAGAFYTKVVGVTFDSRQELVRMLAPGDVLLLRREPDNVHDPHAIKVTTLAGDQIGYLSARVAARLAPSIDSGVRYTATVSQITGGGDRHHGANIYLQRQDSSPDEPDPGQLQRMAWRDLPADDLIDRLRLHLHRGRRLRGPQFEAVRAVADGRSILGVFGPGRGRSAVIEIAATAAAVAGRGTVVIAAPLQTQVERWFDRLAPRLQQVGVRCVRAHGALLFRQRQRLLQSLREGNIDVIIASIEYLRYQGERLRSESSGTGLHAPSDAGLRPALLLVEGEPTIGAATLEEVMETLGHPQLAFFCADVAPEIAAFSTQKALQRVADSFVRTNLRLVDRRDPENREEALHAILARREKTLVFAASGREAVDVASWLRERGGVEVAYYHAGLPLRVREVLEQMFIDGKVGALVAADGFREESAPADLRQVVVTGLPAHRGDLMEQIGVAGLDGKPSVVTLLYRREDVKVVEAELGERHPTRETLAAIYRAVRDQVEHSGAAGWPDEGLAAILEAKVPSRRTIGIGLDVLAEAGVIQREFDGDRWRITLSDDGKRHELVTSLRYAEGQREATALAELTRLAFAPMTEVLRLVAHPAAGIQHSEE